MLMFSQCVNPLCLHFVLLKHVAHSSKPPSKLPEPQSYQSHLDSDVFYPYITWRFMGSYKWSYKFSNMGYDYSYPAYNSTYNYP